MANIDELNFSVTLDDSEFKSKIEQMETLAKTLNTEMTKILSMRTKLSKSNSGEDKKLKEQVKSLKSQLDIEERIRKEKEKSLDVTRQQVVAERNITSTQRARQTTETTGDTQALDSQINKRRELNRITKEGNSHLITQGKLLRELSTMAGAYISVMGGQRLISNLVRVSAEFELQRTTLRAILQDSEQAEKIFSQIKELAVKSPFQFKELASYAKQLSAYSIPVNELYNTTKMLADVSAGLGVDMNRLVLAYGQIRSASFLRGQEVRQLTEAGIPILEELRKQFEELNGEVLTAGDVFDKISTRQVPFEMVARVFKDMTSEGGKFYQMQEVQAETLKGKISNLVDAYEIMFSEIGERNEGFMKGVVDVLRKMIDNYDSLGRAITSVIVGIGAYKAATAVLNIRDWYLKIGKLGDRFRDMGVNVSNAAVAMRKLGISMKSISAATVVGIMTTLAVGIAQAVKKAKMLEEELTKIGNTKLTEADSQVRTFVNLIDALRNAKEGSQDYRDAISRLNRQYGDYLPNLLNEKNALQEILAQSDKVVASIYNRAKAAAYEQGMNEISTNYTNKSTVMIDTAIKRLEKYGISAKETSAFIAKFKEDMMNVGDIKQASLVMRSSWEDFFGSKYEGKYMKITDLANGLAGSFINISKESQNLQLKLNALFSGKSYSTDDELLKVEKIEEKYANLRKQLSKESPDFEKDSLELERQRLSELIDLYEQLSEEDGGSKARTDLLKKYRAEFDRLFTTMTKFRATVNEFLMNMGFTQGTAGELWAKESDGLADYVSKLRKAYKELPSEADLASYMQADKALYDSYVRQKKAIEGILSTLGFSVEVDSGKGGGKKESPEEKALKTKVESVKELMSIYKQLQGMGVNDDTAKAWFKAFFPDSTDITDGLRFKEILLEYADTLEKVYKNTDAANNIRGIFSKDDIKAAMDAYSKLEALRGKLQSWLAEDFNIDGKGIVFDINKLAAELNTKNNGVDLKLQNLKEEFQAAVGNEKALAAIREKYGNEAWAKYLEGGEQALEELARKEKNYNAQAVQEKLRDIAKSYVGEWEGLQSFELSDWANKNIIEIKDIQKAIDNFDPSSLPEGLEAAVKKAGGEVGWQEFLTAFKTALDEIKAKAEEMEKNKSVRIFKKVARVLKEMASSASELAEALGATELAEGVKTIAKISEGFTNFFESAMKDDVIGMVTSGLQTVLQVYVSTHAAAASLADGIRSAKLEARAYASEVALSNGTDTIFGENAMKSISNAVSQLKEVGDALDMDRKKTTLFYQAFDKSTGMLSLSKGQRKFDLKKNVEKLGYELYDEYGNLNSKALQAILNTYTNLDKESRDWLENAIQDSEKYATAMEQLKNGLSDIFGNLADDMAESFIDKYMEIGDATTDLANQMDNIFGDLAQSIAQSLVSAFILDNVLAKYEGEAKTMMERMASGDVDETEIAQYFSTLADGIKNDTEAAAEYTNRLLDALTAQGVTLGSESESSNSLSNGIKSITEDTANLLASYVNAIRADVAASRVSLTDIQTNTFRSAIAAEGILSKLESVIGSFSGGGDGIKVVVQ